MLANQLDLKENQIYKWFWELMNKRSGSVIDDLETNDIVNLPDTRKYEVFINKTLKMYRDQVSLKGVKGQG